MEPQSVSPLLSIGLLFVAAYPAGLLARKLGVPAVTGNILAGVLLGPSFLKVFDRTVAHELEPITIFAMGLITFVTGAHLSYRRLHNALGRILSVTFFQVAGSFLFVTLGALWVGAGWKTAVLLGAIATSGSPAALLAVVREERAKGLLVKTLLASVALDNVLSIVFFAVARSQVVYRLGTLDESLWAATLTPLQQIAFSAFLGVATAGAVLLVIRWKLIEPFSGLFLAILLTVGGAQFFGVSPLLAPLVLGIILGNSGRENEGLITSLESLQPMLLTCFFTLAGVDLDTSKLVTMGALGAVYFFARGTGKILGGYCGAALSGTISRLRNNIGPTFLPQGGLAIGLVVLVQGDFRLPQELITTITNVVLAAVVLNEILGPPLVRRAIARSEEAGKGRRRIVEFLQEEHIQTPLRVTDKWDAIRQLAAFLLKSHGIKKVTPEDLVRSVEERERTISTAMGEGVAIPHAKIPAGPDEIVGVMGICPPGIDFDAPDGNPVHFIVMIATPKEDIDKHLQVMAAVARIVSDPGVRARLIIARNPAEAFEAIETGLTEDYNYFLED